MKYRAGVWWVLLSTIGTSAGAQVNVEANRGDADRQGFSGRGEASASGRAGNTEGIVVGADARIQFRSGRHLMFVLGRGDYTRMNHKTSLASGMGHLRYNYKVVDWLWAEAFGQIQHNKFQRLTSRELVGVGPRFVVYEDDAISVFLGSAYMVEREVLDLKDTDTEDSTTRSHRWSNYINFSVTLDDILEAGTTLYFQPRFKGFGDPRIFHESYFEVEITDVVSNKISTRFRYDREPPDEVKQTDFLITNSFVLEF